MSHIITPDICDAHPDVEVLDPIFLNLGGREAFCGPLRTLKCFEDISLIKQTVSEPGEGAVLIVDGGGSQHCALFGDRLAVQALENGWAGVVVYGCVRDVDALAEMELGIQALGVHPRRGEQHGQGVRDVPVTFAGVTLRPGQWLYADNNGVLVSQTRLPLEG